MPRAATALVGVCMLTNGCTLTTSLDGLGAGGSVSGPPGTLVATAANHQRIDLAWEAAPGAETYEIEQDGVVRRTAVPAPTHQVRGLGPSTQYFFRVRAVVGGIPSEWSSSANATTAVEPTGGYVDQVIADEPRSFWRMEETVGTALVDTMGNASVALIEGADPNVPGRLGSGIGFDGIDDRVNLKTVHTADSDWGWTWELWAQIDVVNEDSSLLLGCSNSPRWTVNVDGSVSYGMAQLRDGAFVGFYTGATVTFGAWHHLVLTVDGAHTNEPLLKFYFDGNLFVIKDDFDGSIHSPWSRGDGGQTTVGDLFLNHRDAVQGVLGAFDEAAAYDYALSEAQVRRHYTRIE